MKILKPQHSPVQYELTPQGAFIIQNYNHSKAFSNFFPGVAGLWGTPMWVFYVNRGQAVSSFGIECKDKAILEFQPANKAYRLTALNGFRTFFKIKDRSGFLFWEPFQNNVYFSPYRTEQQMSITAHDLTLTDVNRSLGLSVEVNYFTLPGEAFPALVRQVRVTNTSRKKIDLEMLDGLPLIVPFGMNDWTLKNMSRTVEAWVKVHEQERNTPYFHLNVEVNDRSDVKHIVEGNFYFAFERGEEAFLPVAIEAAAVFGNSSDFLTPEKFIGTSKFSKPKTQQTDNRMPCAMMIKDFTLEAGCSCCFISVIGHAQSIQDLRRIAKQTIAPGFIERKALENMHLIQGIQQNALTVSSSKAFNDYSGQTFLDNVLRGGLPISLKTGTGVVTFNVYSRKHGDLERDYNYFVLSPTPYSQGNGNYRDVNQNRRSDVWFNPDVDYSSILDFMDLIQADGYNPLVVKGLSFAVQHQDRVDAILKKHLRGESSAIKDRLRSAFQPGELVRFIQKKEMKFATGLSDFLGEVLSVSHKLPQADHGEGFWVDHWVYNLDLIESFLSIYPERLRALLIDERGFSFYLNSHYVQPRAERYVLTAEGVRQYHSVKDWPREIHAEAKGHRLRIRNGEGEVYHTNLLVKLVCLLANKIATLDPSGIGVEMEADKPSWYDALNGLPGLLGSSICETLEIKRYATFLLKQMERLDLKDNFEVQLFSELAEFVRILKGRLADTIDPLLYWNRANDAKEQYRFKIRQGITGEELALTLGEIRSFLKLIIERTDRAVNAAKGPDGLISTYFCHEVTEYETKDGKDKEPHHVWPKAFRLHRLPLFLEGFVHQMRIEQDPLVARELFNKIRASELFDRKLKMYKVNACIDSESEMIGRSRIFPRGWLENESIWLHMEYKYLLELLRQGLYEKFFMSFKQVMIPFQPPVRYGRSTLENSSFLVSSAHADKALHGQGFVARLSGSTAEFVQIWAWMGAGQQPFCYDKKRGLSLILKPLLPGWLFTRQSSTVEYVNSKGTRQTIKLPANIYAFMFLGQVLVVYHNPKRKNTFDGLVSQEITLTYLGGEVQKLKGTEIPMPYSQDVRERKIARIDVSLG